MSEEHPQYGKPQSLVDRLRRCAGDTYLSTVTELEAADDIERLQDERKELLSALNRLSDEYENQRSQFGTDYIWKKYEDKGAIEEARRLLDELKGD